MKPTGQRYHIHNQHQLNSFLDWIHQQWDNGKKPTMQMLEDDRTTNQNSMMFALYDDVSKQNGDLLLDVRRHCKLHYGVGILKASDPDFASFYDKSIKGMSYGDKLLLMTYMEITSQFNKAQATEYLDTIIREYTAQGYRLADPRMK